MPTYQYACTECDHRFEAVQAFTDDSLTVCPVCGGPLRKVYGSVGVVFKGSGFYRTDSRAASTSTAPANGSGEKSGSDKSGGDNRWRQVGRREVRREEGSRIVRRCQGFVQQQDAEHVRGQRSSGFGDQGSQLSSVDRLR